MTLPGLRRREPLSRRTFAPVRRNSRHAGGERPERMTRRQASLRLAAMDQLSRKLPKGKGQRRGCKDTLSIWAEKVYAYLLDRAVRFAGQVYPTYAAIAEGVGCHWRTVARCLKQLHALGWLKWDRRFEYTGQQGQRGPQVRQTSNFYFPLIPTAAAALLEAWKGAKAKRDGAKESPAEMAERLRRAAARPSPDPRTFDAAIARGRARGEARNSAERAARRSLDQRDCP